MTRLAQERIFPPALSNELNAKAQVVKLVDTLASGASDLTVVAVQVRPWAPFLERLSNIKLPI